MKKGKVYHSVEKPKTQKNANQTLFQRVHFASTQTEWSFDAKILPGCCENFKVFSGGCFLHFRTYFFTINNLFKKHKNMRLHIVFLGISLNGKKQFF